MLKSCTPLLICLIIAQLVGLGLLPSHLQTIVLLVSCTRWMMPLQDNCSNSYNQSRNLDLLRNHLIFLNMFKKSAPCFTNQWMNVSGWVNITLIWAQRFKKLQPILPCTESYCLRIDSMWYTEWCIGVPHRSACKNRLLLYISGLICAKNLPAN